MGGTNIAANLDRSLQPNVRVKTLLVRGLSTAPADMIQVTDSGAHDGEAFLNYGVTDDATILAAAGAKNVALRQAQTDIARFPIKDGDDEAAGLYTPSWPGDGGHFWLGDTVTIYTGTGEFDYNDEELRVAAIEWRMRSTGDFQVWVELGATFYDFSKPGDSLPGSSVPPTSQTCTCPLPPRSLPHRRGRPAVRGVHLGRGRGACRSRVRWKQRRNALSGDCAGRAGASAEGTTHCGNLGNGDDNASGRIACTPGETYTLTGYFYKFGTSWGHCAAGKANESVGVQWYTSGAAHIQTDIIQSWNCMPVGWFPFSGAVVAPATAAYFKLSQQVDLSLPGQTGSNRLDQVRIYAGLPTTDDLCGLGAYGSDRRRLWRHLRTWSGRLYSRRLHDPRPTRRRHPDRRRRHRPGGARRPEHQRRPGAAFGQLAAHQPVRRRRGRGRRGGH